MMIIDHFVCYSNMYVPMSISVRRINNIIDVFVTVQNIFRLQASLPPDAGLQIEPRSSVKFQLLLKVLI